MSLKIIDDFANLKEQLEILNYVNNNNLLYSFDNTSIRNKKFMTSNTIDYHKLFMKLLGMMKYIIMFYFLTFILCYLNINYLTILFIE